MTRDRRRAQRGERDRAAGREPARARLPGDRLEIVVTSDASTDAPTSSPRRPGARVIRQPARRQGRGAGPRRARDGRRSWRSPTRTRPGRPTRCARSCAPFADPDVAYVCGRLNVQAADGSNQEGLYWRYELGVRAAESRLGSVTGGNGSIYALRRSDYVEVDPRFGHDLSLPYLMVQRGRRAVYEPDANAFEKPTPTNEDEYRRKVRMFEHCWLIVLEGRMLRRLGPLYSSRSSRTGFCATRAGCSTSSCSGRRSPSLGHGSVYAVVLGAAARPARRRARGRRHRALLRPRHVGDRAVALQLPAPWRAGDLGRGGGHALNRAADVSRSPARRSCSRRPVLALAALAVKLTSRGPALYRQTRVGKDGADFELLKLRTMVVGAESQGAGFAVDRGDPRITPVGRAPSPAVARRAAAALERRPRRHVRDRPAADASLPGRALHRAAATAARR